MARDGGPAAPTRSGRRRFVAGAAAGSVAAWLAGCASGLDRRPAAAPSTPPGRPEEQVYRAVNRMTWGATGAALRQVAQSGFDAYLAAQLDPRGPDRLPAGVATQIAALTIAQTTLPSLLSDIKPGYMLGAKPRQQAIGHVIGIFAGALSVVPLYFLLFLPPDANGLRSTATIVSDQFAMPNALQWKGVAELIAKGFGSLPTTAVISMVVAAIAALCIELARIFSKGRFPLSSVSIGLGVVLPAESCLAMWLGAVLFWWMGRRHTQKGSHGHDFWVEGCEPICAGLISGAALTGIGNAIINVLM